MEKWTIKLLKENLFRLVASLWGFSLQSHKSVLFQKRADMNMFCYKDSYEMEALTA